MHVKHKGILAQVLMGTACTVFVVSTIAMLLKFDPFYSSYYMFAWWSFILFIESMLYLRGGSSLLFEDPLKFLIMLPLSATVWNIFEALNFRLSDWHYIRVPSDILVRWPGYFLSYATVLPGIFSTTALLNFAGILKNSKTSPLQEPQKLYKPFFFIGVLFFVLPLVWPEYYFPLVWGSFLFLLEPVNHKFGAPSLLRHWENGSLRKFYLLLIAGALCGFLWEMWNFRAGAKWIYTVPYVGVLKVFEMPLLGFVGFPPFAVECYAMSAAFFLMASQVKKRYPQYTTLFFTACAILFAVFNLLVFAGIDRFTVISFE